MTLSLGLGLGCDSGDDEGAGGASGNSDAATAQAAAEKVECGDGKTLADYPSCVSYVTSYVAYAKRCCPEQLGDQAEAGCTDLYYSMLTDAAASAIGQACTSGDPSEACNTSIAAVDAMSCTGENELVDEG